jgi:hypothetical protein
VGHLVSYYFVSNWLVETFRAHRTTTNHIKLVGMAKYADKELANHFNESQF